MPTKEELKELQSKPLEEKIQISTARIIEWYKSWEGQVFVSFSGGKDSTVLLDLVRKLYPDVEGVFFDTGLELPEIREFVKTKDNIKWLKPKMSFVEVLSKVGYPVGTKRIALNIEYGRKARDRGDTQKFDEYVNGLRHGKDGTDYKFMPVPQQLYPLVDAPVRISNKCCQIMKKDPANKYVKESGKKPFNGTIAQESKMREDSWLKHGCNVFSKGHEVSHPLSFWTENDILEYLYKYKIPYSSAYGEIIKTDTGYYTTGEKRTGCCFCLFGTHLQKPINKIQSLALSHPNLWEYCCGGGEFKDGIWQPSKGLGLAYIMDLINVPWWNDGDEEKRDEYRRIYHEKEEAEAQRKLTESETNE